jgi:hypothetical protein
MQERRNPQIYTDEQLCKRGMYMQYFGYIRVHVETSIAALSGHLGVEI